MLTFAEALELIIAQAGQCAPKDGEADRVETVPLEDAHNRILAQNLEAPFDLPRFNNSAVDGFGVLVQDVARAGDAPVALKLIATSAAGQSEGDIALTPGTCVKILTGAPVPDSVEAIIMREFCVEDENTITVETSARIGENIRMTGEELEEGRVVLSPGTRLSPPAIGLAATVGASSLLCYRQPRVALVSTGDELVEPGRVVAASQIYNSNGPALRAALLDLNLRPQNIELHHALDTRSSVRQTLDKALAAADILITIGGVSMGDRDYVKAILEEREVKTIFWKAAIKPGKPIYFATTESGKLIFGLPGNPVSALMTFHLFVKPALALWQGAGIPPVEIQKARLLNSLKKKAGRLDFVRARLTQEGNNQLSARPTTGQDSHMLTGLLSADALLYFEKDSEYLAEGDTVDVRRLAWNW